MKKAKTTAEAASVDLNLVDGGKALESPDLDQMDFSIIS